ncbi:MAG: hypothetical protein AAFY03_03120, partial [Pseudomonadota bacterium]
EREGLERGWLDHLRSIGFQLDVVYSEAAAIRALEQGSYSVIVMDVVLNSGSAFAVADYASYRHPETNVIFVTNTVIFSDGSIFQHASNACAFIRAGAPCADLAAMVEHYGKPNPVPTEPQRAAI